MSHTEKEPRSALTILKIKFSDMELDKTRDGRYWRVLYWPDAHVVLQLRIRHMCWMEADDFIAEVKLLGADDSWGQSEEGFTTLSEFMHCAVELEDAEPDLDGFPNIFRDEFITMVRYWGRVLEMMECGPAMGTLSPSALKAEKAASLGGGHPEGLGA